MHGQLVIIGIASAAIFLIVAFARVISRERRSRERAEGLARVALALGPHLNVEALSETLAEEMRRLLHAERASFWMLRDGAIERVHSAGYGQRGRELIKSIEGLQLGERPGMDELAAGLPVIVEDPAHDAKLLRDPARFGLRSYMAVPIVVDDELRGILSCSERSHRRSYSADDVATAQALAAQASAAVRNALLYELTFEASRSDHLTGLGNRRAFHEQLEVEIARSRRHRRDLSVLMLDVDYLKQVNDSRGHSAGDEILASVGALLHDTIRREDGVYRIGGDEFAFVLPETGPERASVAAERIRVAVEREHLAVDATCDVTVSIGISSYPDHGASPDDLFERADAALYEAKRGGRNAVSAALAFDRPA